MLIGEEGIDNLRLSEGESGVKIEQDARYNSVYLVRNGEIQRDRGTNGPATRYDKIHLTPFGETMPGISRWKWLEQQMLNFGGRGLKFDLGVGSRYTRFEIPLDTQPTGLQRPAALRAVTPICFEVTDSELCRRLVYEGSVRKADVIASVTNDGWFSWSDATRRQHLQIARWRCVELGVPMIRAANTGISAIVQSDGSISKELPPRSESVLRGEITIGGGTTCFASLGAVFGDLFGRGCLAITVGLCCVALWKERRIAGAKVK
jgi:apolipoprotein N-acyltransferase